MVEPVPCILERKILPKVWGGRALSTTPGINLPEGEMVGETWELFDRPDGSSKIHGGDGTLRDLMREHRAEVLGPGVQASGQGGYFPLLLKFIDAKDALSVQVHPDDEQARAANDSGKSEAWIVLSRGEQGRIILGLREGVTAEEFAKVAHTADVEGVLHAFRPEVGDAIYVPAGTVHAIGPDVVLFEIQQNSDVTYRLYDWGRPRETHVEQALAAVRGTGGRHEAAGIQQAEPIPGGGEWLLRTEHFQVRRYKTGHPQTLGTEGSYKVVTVLGGTGILGWRSKGDHPPVVLRAGDTALVPACIGDVFLSPSGELDFLWSGPGGA